MPLYAIESNSLEQRVALDRSPEAVLLTNTSNFEHVPAPIRHASDRTISLAAVTPETFRRAYGENGTVVWLDGETLLDGEPETIRRALRYSGRTSFVTVHFPCVANLDLLAIQPRFFTPGKQKEEAIEFAIRIGCSGQRTEAGPPIFQRMREPWARLSQALYQERVQSGASLVELDRLRRDEKLPPILDALVQRNLVALQMRHGCPQQALKLLQQARRQYPEYAELVFIEALLSVQSGDATRAVNLLEEIINKPKGVFVSSGGETSYRAQWLVGVIGDLVGNQSVSSSHYFSGVCARPSFEPSVVGLLKQRLPADVVDSMQRELCHLVRRELRYLEPVFYFLLVHRAFSAAQHLMDTLPITDDQRAALLLKFNMVRCSYEPRHERSAGATGIVFTGPFFVHSSIARVNGELAAALLSRSEFITGLEPHGFSLISSQLTPNGNAIVGGLYNRPPHLDLTIRHHWPHDFSRPSSGKLAAIVPWEFGAVPRKWINEIEANVDELWVPSEFVKDVFVRCGVPPERIAIVPNGVNIKSFCPEGPFWRPPGAQGFIFLFVGGAIMRKGVDVLLKAYQSAFTSQDDVTLIIKDIGSQTFYRHMSLVPWLKKEAEKPGSPRLLVLLDEFDEPKLAELYRGSDAVVLPYRGEGFGMPLVEGMACGKPVIATAEGPAPEFCPADCSYLIPARSVSIPGGIPGFGELAGDPTWFEPDADELARVMRDVYENRTEAAFRGTRAGELIRPAYNWRRVTQMYIDRIAALTHHDLSMTAVALQSAD
jgi:glycosyltransferase involved in cell wall biosynthesis